MSIAARFLPRHRRRLRTVVPTGLAMVLPAAGIGLAAGDQVRLTIEGAPTLAVAGGCSVLTAAGEKTLEIDTAPPFVETFAAEGLSCRLTATGEGSATLTIDGPGGNRSVTGLTPGGMAVVTVR